MKECLDLKKNKKCKMKPKEKLDSNLLLLNQPVPRKYNLLEIHWQQIC